ncbi:hypothetical protein GMST_28240 [Geomonas silvestris]|uniref:AAA domain-containing protein n=1 Tax=Geomonas silvestris TaxID=2740184 RepID=A0A6V8MLI5_9BACT|nr:hypothetical protein GMST_28240 [Geomonas silvestris]
MVFDADSSQHSALIDVLSGKNLVINGPPGTGKSQTITNVIAAGLKEGKSILFVSDKLAALEVVRHRLNKANLGCFCLELHSHKTQKKKLLGEIQDRIDTIFRPPQQLQDKILTLRRHKKELNRYAELMSLVIGNRLNLSVHDIFWRNEKQRQTIGDFATAVQSVFLADASHWTYDDIELRRAKLDTLGQLYESIGAFDLSHPWWGFTANPFAPGDDETIGRIISEALALADKLLLHVLEYQEKVGDQKEPSLAALRTWHETMTELPAPPENLKADLLPKAFNLQDPLGKKSTDLLNQVVHKVQMARELNEKADGLLSPVCDLDWKTAEPILAAARKELSPSALAAPLELLREWQTAAETSIEEFGAACAPTYSFTQVTPSLLQNLQRKLVEMHPLVVHDRTVESIREGAAILSREISRLEASLLQVEEIAKKRNIDFNGSPSALASLRCSDGIEGIVAGVSIDDGVLAKASEDTDSLPLDLPLFQLDAIYKELRSLAARVSRAVDEAGEYARQLGLPFDGAWRSLMHLSVLARVSAEAPADLLDFRRPSLAYHRVAELMSTAEEAQKSEKSQREALHVLFHLDALPSQEELKSAIRAFRRGDGLFNFLSSEWRNARKLFQGISKSKQKLKASEYEAQLSSIVRWQEDCAAFVENSDFKETFGPLFTGMNSDFGKVRRLHRWYSESQGEMLRYPGLLESCDLSALDSRKILQLAALSHRLQEIAGETVVCSQKAGDLVPPLKDRLDSLLQREGWNAFVSELHELSDRLERAVDTLSQYVRPHVAPKRALEILNAKKELLAVRGDFDALETGVQSIAHDVGRLLPGIETIPCNYWKEFLGVVSGIGTSACTLAENLSVFGVGAATVGDLVNFVDLKVRIDAALQKFAALPEGNHVGGWEAYLSAVSARVAAAASVTSLLIRAGRDGKTTEEVTTGLIARQDAENIICGIAGDPAVTAMLGDVFEGIETDLDSLTATVAWGAKVAGNLAIRSSLLQRFLLQPEAVGNFAWAAIQLCEIVSLRDNVRGKVNELERFGTIKHNEWYSSVTGKETSILASTVFEKVNAAASHVPAVLPWSKYIFEREQSKKLGLGNFVHFLEQKALVPGVVGATFEYVTYRSIGRKIYKKYPELENFIGTVHENIRSEFAALDKEIISLTGKSFAHAIDRAKTVPEGYSGYRASDRTEMNLLRNELGKQRRHIAIRQLIRRAGRAIQALKPCFMMGPLSVAQYLEQGCLEFDMVVMDEASQLRPEDALGAVARGKQLVVVGDPKQLPPTNFFDRMLDSGDEDDDEAPAVLAGSESILDICSQLFHPVRTLKWHYRSQHQSLIAFSNFHFYNSKLVVFPAPFERNSRLGVRYRYVKNGVYKDRQNVPEAQCVVDSVIDHMVKFPEESLGVVTLNQTQRELVEDMLDKRLRNLPEAQHFIEDWEKNGWPFFVKNLENVQGDERDVIFVSTTFGKAPGAEKPRQNFGPISRPDGWRRLNVLFTRSRRKLELFTSMLPEDIVIDTKTPDGTKALKDYLDFARRGILTDTNLSEREADSDFELAVGDFLRCRGYEVVPQLGVAGFFIDLAVRNPDRPGEYLAAIECDGVTYHSSRSARDRDRIRESVLESLGWKGRIWRIWSTEWFYNPRKESARLLEFLACRRAESAAEPASEFEYEEFVEDLPGIEGARATETTVEALGAEVDVSPTVEDLYVEVGDTVTYCALDKPDQKHTVMIVDSESNARLNLINESTPLALALLDCTVGDETELEVKGSPVRVLRVLKIQRKG